MANKADKVKARLPRGLVDRHAADIRATDKMLAAIREVYERYGFDPVETPMLEYTDALGKFLPDQDRPNEGVFSLPDDDEQWLSLRYDLTAPLARHVAENFNEIQLPYRTYRAGYVFRNEKPGPGRFRQFMQFDADTVGAPGVAADAEMCMMMADVMDELGLKGQYVVRVNNRKILDGVMEANGVTDEGQKLIILRAIDKLDKFGKNGVRELLGVGRKDKSGDFTKGAGLTDEQIAKMMQFITVADRDYDDESQKKAIDPVFKYGTPDGLGTELKPLTRAILESGFNTSDLLVQGIDELKIIRDLAIASGYDDGRIVLDPSCVRGLEYYTGPVFEVELTAEIPNEKGEIVRFGSVGGGGRYDGLVSRFRGQPVPATGFSIGVSRLMTALKNLGKLGEGDVLAPVLVTVMDGDMEAMGRYQDFTQKLRNAGIRAEMYQGNWKKFGNQLKYADRRGAPLAIIQGADERANGEVQIKDLIEGKRLSEEIESNEEWRATRPAQVTVKEADLVAEVRKILDQQAEDRARGA